MVGALEELKSAALAVRSEERSSSQAVEDLKQSLKDGGENIQDKIVDALRDRKELRIMLREVMGAMESVREVVDEGLQLKSERDGGNAKPEDISERHKAFTEEAKETVEVTKTLLARCMKRLQDFTPKEDSAPEAHTVSEQSSNASAGEPSCQCKRHHRLGTHGADGGSRSSPCHDGGGAYSHFLSLLSCDLGAFVAGLKAPHAHRPLDTL